MGIESKDLLELLGSSISFGSKLCTNDKGYQIEEIDDNYARLIGIPEEQKNSMIGKTMADCIHPDDLESIVKKVHHSERTGEISECIYRLRTENGNYIWVRDISETVVCNGRERLQSVVINIDDQVQVQRQKDIVYEKFPGSVVFLVIGRDNFYIREANQNYFDMVGVRREDYLGSSGKYTFPEDLPRLRECLVTHAEKCEPVDFEFRIRKETDTGVYWYRLIGNYYETLPDGREYLCVMVDITNRKRTQFELIKEKENYRMEVSDQVPDVLYEYDVKEQRFRLYGEGYVTEDMGLCMDPDCRIPYKQLIYQKDFIHKNDRKVIAEFIRQGRQRYDKIRLLTLDPDTGERYYGKYEIYLNKVYEGSSLVRVMGYVKKLGTRTISPSVKHQIHQIFDEHLIKDYLFVLKIDAVSESFTPYYAEESVWEEYRGNRSYDRFLKWWCENEVVPDKQKEISFFLSVEQMLRVLYSGEPRGYRFCRVKGRDGKYQHAICYFAFYGSDVNTIILDVRNVEVVRAEEEYQNQVNQRLLQEVLTEAKDAVAARQSFMDYVVKELSAPIVTVKQLLNNDYNEQTIPHIRRCMEYMSEMIGSITEYNQLQAPHDKSAKEINLYELCTQVCEQERRISLGLDISIAERIMLSKEKTYRVHEYYFRDILINLIGNAVKYAPKGSTVNVYVKENVLEDGKLVISIVMEDEGPVINERFFERSVEEDDWQDQREKILALGGVGYSISIVSKIVGLLGGSIQFCKGVVYSSVVQIEIPVFVSSRTDDVASESTQEDMIENEEKSLDGQGILLVERETGDNAMTAPILRVNGAMVYTAANGCEAEQLLNRFDSGILSAILVDRELEDMNCYEFARRIKYTTNHIIRELPIIMMLDGIESEDVKMGLLSGVNATISKPVNINKLKTIMENLQGKWQY